MSKTVLMTGADGFIGSNVLQYLLNNTSWKFTIIASWRHHGSPLNVPVSNRVEVVTHDLRGPIPDLGDFDYILNLASESHVDRSIADPVNFIENNIALMLNVLEYARMRPVKRFIQFSTDEVYGPFEHDEWDILTPKNPYSASKAAQEMICIGYRDTYKIPIIITNANNVVGENQHPEKFVPKIVEQIKAGKTVTLHATKGRYGRRFYNPVNNVAHALKFILGLSYSWQDRLPRYGLGGGVELDNKQMAEKVAEMLGKPLKFRTVEATSVRPAYDDFYPENTTALENAGWRRPYTLESGLRWIKQT